MASIESKPTLALLGATGGSVLSVLVLALQNDYKCTALVRTPSKLTELLQSAQITSEKIFTNLTIIPGSSKDTTNMSEFVSKNPDIIISGVGSYPSFKNPLKPTILDPTLCQDTISTLLSCLKTHQSTPSTTKKPLVVMISTTGISDFGRDIPIACIPLYYWLLPVPHRDKKAMEKLVIGERTKGDEGVISGFVAVRPSLLTDGAGVGVEKIKVGVEREGDAGKAGIGYSVARRDVGGWIFERLVRGERRGEFLDKAVAISA